MTTDEMKAVFESFDDEFIKFERIENPRHPRPDICAFLILHDLSPNKRDMVCAAEHDEIFLDADPETVASVVTPEQIRDLSRCGVRFHDDGFCMFA